MSRTLLNPLTSPRARPALLVSVLALSLAACSRPVLREADPMPVATVIPQAAYPATDTPAEQGPSIAALGWQTFFADPALKQLIQLGLDHNRDLRTATLNIQRAQAQYQIRQSAQQPTVTANGSVMQQGNTDHSNTAYSVGLGATAYELDLWGRVANLKGAALNNYLATQSAQQATRIALIGQISQAYLALAFDQEQLKLAQQTLSAQQDSLKLNRKRQEVGIASAVPVRQSEISVETARLAIANTQTQLAQDRNLLALLIGQPVPVALLPSSAPTQVVSPASLSAGLPSDLLRNRPDLAQAEYALKAAGANIAAARAAFYPTISLTGTLGLSSTSLSDLFKSGAFNYGIGPSISLPIFDAGARQANLAMSQTDQHIALSQYESAIQAAFREVADVLATRSTLNDRLDAQQRLVAATQANYTLAQARYKAGLDNYLTVLDAQRNLFSTQQAAISLQQAALISQVNLYKVLGGGAVDPAVTDTAAATP
ncbi:MAG: hypothetical protein RLY58_165 [Pseudomonadota bacterium]